MSSSKNLEFKKTGFLSKSNSAFIEQMYLQYINRDPSLPDSWKDYFDEICLLYTSPSPRDVEESRMPSSA